ncbi:TPA: hypothetical protein U1B15_000923 [Streptococcus suis]|nr:hypothetical protein [Streptococcus suis]QZS51036.1 hypothetical protein K6976_09520 [Streptococcus suis]QZS60712.1 hypothetical protein K6972_09150 [Streptococcus suis]HEM3428327.1 hypothetical protein [Streptococcus suis]HEM3451235.1 hypothetical protein [Streptococcus suis]HEM3498480.1 hypothetical protein [Streptococcus suis]
MSLIIRREEEKDQRAVEEQTRDAFGMSFVRQFIFYYIVNSFCCTPVLSATRCLVLK